MIIKEACVESVREAISAANLGAQQLELCVRLDLDGNSPPLDLIEKVLSAVSIPVKVIVNPFPYHYQYTRTEKEEIVDYINKLKSASIAGLVLGPMTRDYLPDIDFLKQIRQLTSLPITFHKAIDQGDIPKSIDMLKEVQVVDYILSSGGAPSAQEGKATLLQMKAQLSDSNISLIAAGKITEENLDNLHASLQLDYYHGRKIVGTL